jgi:phospholipid transport system substrate-binding protein
MSNHDNQHHITRRGFFLISTGIGLVAAQPSALALSAVEQYVAGIGADVIRLANSSAPKAAMRRRFSALVSRYANVRSVGLVALGPYQKQLPVNRRDEFFRLVADYIAAFFVSYIDDFKGARLNVISSADQGRSTIVESRITSDGGRDTRVNWRITSGRVSDVNVSGIWLSLQLKKRFTDILKRTDGNFNPLFAELRSAESW